MEEKWETVNQIRAFNRFYTVLLGFLNRNYLNSGYSVTEVRILFELKENESICANRLIDMLHLDKSYISRLIRNFEQREMITRETASDDRRTLVIQLTPKGREEVERLIEITNAEILGLIEQLDSAACRDLCKSMKMVMDIFMNNRNFQEENHESKS